MACASQSLFALVWPSPIADPNADTPLALHSCAHSLPAAQHIHPPPPCVSGTLAFIANVLILFMQQRLEKRETRAHRLCTATMSRLDEIHLPTAADRSSADRRRHRQLMVQPPCVPPRSHMPLEKCAPSWHPRSRDGRGRRVREDEPAGADAGHRMCHDSDNQCDRATITACSVRRWRRGERPFM